MIEWGEGRILAVDDNRVNRLVLEKRLAQAGFTVDLASDGREALDILGLGEGGDGGRDDSLLDAYDVVVLDIMMPEVDGIEVLRKIREVRSPSEVPVIMATAKDQSEDMVEALEAGCNDYVTKPIDMPVLVARLRTQGSLKRTYLALKEAQQALVDATKMEAVGYLAAGVAHEVRNPLAQIQMGMELLAGSEAIAADAQLKSMAGIVTDAVERMDKIVRQLMRISRDGQLELQGASINEVVREAVEGLGEAGDAAGVAIELDLDETVPMILLSLPEMNRIISHVVSNAVEASSSGGRVGVRTFQAMEGGRHLGPDSRSGMRLRQEDHPVVVEVTDSGPGIRPSKLKTVFDPFYTTKAPGEGTGLGLSIARKMVELHHGMITVENREDGDGVRVSIMLPTMDAVRTSV